MAVVGNKGLAPSGTTGPGNASAFTKTYNSFSGVDMVLTFGGKIIGEAQGISFTVQREKAPIYTMGEADPRSFSRGKRGIAGSVVFQTFDRSALLEVMKDRPYIANKYSIPQGFEITDVQVGTVEAAAGLIGSLSGSANPTVSRIVLDKVLAKPQYLDQVLPFDIVITGANEYGAFMEMRIHGVEILNCGTSISIDDVSIDEACTFIATSITPWKDQGFVRINDDGKSATITK